MAVELDPIVAPSSQKQDLIDNGLTPLLHQLQQLEVWDEIGNIRSATLVEFAYQNWRSAFSPQVTRNRSSVSSGFTTDFTAGTLSFSATLVDGDEVRVSYGFRYYTDDELGDFLELALNTLNNQRPQTTFEFVNNNIPAQWETSVIELAYAHALETLMQDLMTWKADLIFKDPRALLGVLQGVVARIYGSWSVDRREIKGRRFLKPKAIASGRWRFPRTVQGFNFQAFTVIR